MPWTKSDALGLAALLIEQTRAILADLISLRQNRLRAYDYTTDRGAAALNHYARTNDSLALLSEEQRAIEVSSVIRASPDSFRIAY